MTKPILSICIPTYNRGRFAYDAAMHVLSAYKGDDIEVVISNNCSEDNTEELISQINDPRLSYYANEENLGAAYNTHLTFLRAKGKFAYLTSDEDDININQISYLISYFKENPDTAIFIGGGNLKYTKKRFPDAVYTEPFDALMAIAFQTRYMTGLILNQEYYAEKLSGVSYEESPEIWDAYSFMYAMALLCCCGPVVTSSKLLFQQSRFTMTDISNNARKDGIYYYEPAGRINQMGVWIRTIMRLPLSPIEKQMLVIKIVFDTAMLAARIFTPGYVEEVKKTVPKSDYQIYLERIKELKVENLCHEIFVKGNKIHKELFGSDISAVENDQVREYFNKRSEEIKGRIDGRL